MTLSAFAVIDIMTGIEQMKKMDGKTLDIVSENIGKLKEIFPEVFTEGKIDFGLDHRLVQKTATDFA